MDSTKLTNEIRTRRGLDPINPFVIQDSGEPPAPPLPLPDLDSEEEDFGPDYTEPSTESPLIALGQQADKQPLPDLTAVQAGSVAVPDLVIWGEDATYKTRSCKLSEQEQTRVARVVVGALARLVRDQQTEISALLPQRKRRKKAVAEPPKKRGRPRKVQPEATPSA